MLIDYATYAQRQGISVSHFGNHPITLDVVLAIAKEQNVEFHQGDILFIRTGYAAKYTTLSDEERAKIAGVKEWCGLGQGKDTTQWLWDRQFAAVASDSPGFEVRREFSHHLGYAYTSQQLTLCTKKSAGRPGVASAPHLTRRLGHSDRGALRLGQTRGSV